jgi:hypothetical protein
MVFTAYWTADEALTIFEFLGELREVIWSAYESEMVEIYQSEDLQNPNDQQSIDPDFDDDIPF